MTANALQILFFGGIGGPEVLLIVLVVLLFFGAKRIPELMKSLGKGVRSFKDGVSEIEREINSDSSAKKEESSEKKD